LPGEDQVLGKQITWKGSSFQFISCLIVIRLLVRVFMDMAMPDGVFRPGGVSRSLRWNQSAGQAKPQKQD
jgi:hypothetical protein